MEVLFNFDLESLIRAVGYMGILAITFAESGLLIGFFLPGDSLLFTAGFLASQGFLNIAVLMAISMIGAIAGDSVGYAFGKNIGPRIFTKDDSLFFHKDHLRRAELFYERYGAKTIVIARFMPVVRTFAPILAGVGKMKYRVFALYNIIGGILWAAGLSGLGYYLGNAIPNIDRYLLPIIVGIIILSVAPTCIHVLRNKEYRAQIIRAIVGIWTKKKSNLSN